MIIPKDGDKRAAFIKNVVDTCAQSRENRLMLYARRRRYYLFGRNDGESQYNRIDANLDLVSSFLYSPDHPKFSVAPPPHSEDDTIEKMIELGKYWSSEFRDSNLAELFSDALIWSLVYDTMFIKMGWNDARKELFATIVDPVHMGVWNEGIVELSNQPAFTHTYLIDLEEAAQRLARAGMLSELKKFSINQNDAETDMSPILRNLIIPGGPWGPGVSDPVIGQINSQGETAPTYQSESRVAQVKWTECYVWDDQFDDWAMFTYGEGFAEGARCVVSDSRETIMARRSASKIIPITKTESDCNIFLPGEHPFIMVQPYRVYDYFWGAAHIEKLIPLQKWSDKRIGEIHALLARQVRPSKLFAGFDGQVEEKYWATGEPDNWVTQMTGADIKELKPEIPEDCFAELKEITALFIERSGLTETLQGRGEQGVRGRGHAKQLAATGSGRIRKVAIGLEKPLAKIAEIGIKLIKHNSEDALKTEDKKNFLPAQIDTPFTVRVAGHSASPLFRDETKDDALILLKVGAIDQLTLIDVMDPPNAPELKHALKKRIAAKVRERKERAAQGLPPEDDGKKKKAA